MNYFNSYLLKHMFCVRKRNISDASFTQTKHSGLIGKIIIFGGSLLYVYLPIIRITDNLK